MMRPWITFDDDGTPRVHIEETGGREVSVRVSADGLAAFVGEVKDALMMRAGDPELQRKVGKSLIDILAKWARS